MRLHRRRLRQGDVDVDLAEEEHRAGLAVERERVLAAPADAAARRELDLEHRRRVRENAVAERADRLAQPLGERAQALAQDLVVVAAAGIEGDRGLRRRRQPVPLDRAPLAGGRARQVVEPRRDDAHGARHQLRGPGALAAVRGQVVHLAMKTVIQPGGEARLGLGQVDAGDADLGKSERASPFAQALGDGSAVERRCHDGAVVEERRFIHRCRRF
jgi:hypothetical protein